jgi:deoxyribodipyrimidine photo-lyase
MTAFKTAVPSVRIRALNDHPPNPDGSYVLYWMTAYRRTVSNFALQRAAEWSRHLVKPLVVLSALRLGYPWATDRSHAFILDGIADVDVSLQSTGAVHLTYVEQTADTGKGLLAALASDAALIVTDDAPVFFLPRMIRAAADRVRVSMEGVDHNGLLPLAATDRVFARAYDLRRFLHRELPSHLDDVPEANPLRNLPTVPGDLLSAVKERWPSRSPDRSLVDTLPLDHSVAATPLRGGESVATERLDHFVSQRLDRYGQRNHPDEQVTSGLAPYLHFGHVSSHQVFDAVAAAEGWTMEKLSDKPDGRRQGWWGMSAAAEGFLDQVITWRELGYQAAARVPDNGSYGALPAWAQATLHDHEDDPREYTYTLDQFDAAATHDEIWNAAQRQLRVDGTIHNYLRMLWGKKILEWSRSAQYAHDIMFELNNRYALDGRDPNSISGIHWVLGRYDRPWGPERSIFGKVRYMSSDATRRKLRMNRYLGDQSLF